MSCVTVYGASDDLIEIEGDLSEEFTPSDDHDTWLVFGDGTILSVRYDQTGTWRITRTSNGTAAMIWEEASADDGNRADGKPAYSDVVTLIGDLRWLVVGEKVTFNKIAEGEDA